jgi:hypothetical protein
VPGIPLVEGNVKEVLSNTKRTKRMCKPGMRSTRIDKMGRAQLSYPTQALKRRAIDKGLL